VARLLTRAFIAATALLVGAGLFLFLGWLLVPISGLLLGLNVFGLRAKLASRVPAVANWRGRTLGLLVGVGGLILWIGAITLLSKSSSQQAVQAPLVTSVPVQQAEAPVVAVRPTAKSDLSTAGPTATLVPPTPIPPTATPSPPPTAIPATTTPVPPTPVPDKPAAVPAYDYVESTITSLPTRPRYRTDIVVPVDYGDDQMIAVLVDAARRTLRERTDARAVVVFAYSSRAQMQQIADKGRAYTSRDGLGWTGDKTFFTSKPNLADEGKVYITLGSALTTQREVVAEK
jgi:hypothetical protein